MNFSFLDEDPFLSSFKNKKPTLFPNMDMPEVTWDAVLEFINKHEEKRVTRDELVSPYSFFYNQAQIIAEVNSFAKQVHKRFGLGQDNQKVLTCQLFGCTKLEDGQMVVKHADRDNNIFWQGKGKSRWLLFDSIENEKPFMDVILEERDLLYVPGGTVHLVEPITPRFGFAVLFGELR